eukprot:CAMPEP_0119334580 /NCGR_PEP_ID=MMETSP1333-20130426/87615_1 /TAXON_ID=418940 /ORGANISM="Scyphosphaera apsteinii, Strain RCC1455" /LENGTH=401 /DNA_ID=CAMNT_0007344909 /DNA_START=79 /DNA_END=1284 /DNA_ORIENTATION=+
MKEMPSVAVTIGIAGAGLVLYFFFCRRLSGRKKHPVSNGDGVLPVLRDEVLRYSQVWEDEELLTAGLAIGPADRILSIASAGDNVLSMLLAEPTEILAVDVNPAQAALVELKLAAIGKIDHCDFLVLLGYASCPDVEQRRRDLCASLQLSPEVRDYWARHDEILSKGIASTGRLETYFRRFVEMLETKGIWPSDGVPRLFAAQTITQQLKVWDELCTPRFEEVFLKYFARETQAKEGRSAQQLQYVRANVAETQLVQLKKMLTKNRCADNFYLRRLFDYRTPTAGAQYLELKSYARLRQLIPRVTLRVQSLQDAIKCTDDKPFTKICASDIFEYMSMSDAQTTMETFAAAMPSGGRLAYWELYNERPPMAEGSFEVLDESEVLTARDRNMFYRSFKVLRKK